MKKETKTISRGTLLDARRWHIVDAAGKTVGRLATVVAAALRGKNNPAFSPHLDCGDFVVVINARQIRFTGNKLQDKIYYRHTEYPGGIRSTSAGQMLASKPEEVVRLAVEGMLPKTRLGRSMATKLKVYAGSEHPHRAQQPMELNVGE
ncbi:MAG: 50S ribosomal protein L13 [Deltaproteobacteria bacterium]|nr:50S ribosomal protein L13 [Deltaproteobacteria bacterium]